jgi:hypothetical protein
MSASEVDVVMNAEVVPAADASAPAAKGPKTKKTTEPSRITQVGLVLNRAMIRKALQSRTSKKRISAKAVIAATAAAQFLLNELISNTIKRANPVLAEDGYKAKFSKYGAQPKVAYKRITPSNLRHELNSDGLYIHAGVRNGFIPNVEPGMCARRGSLPKSKRDSEAARAREAKALHKRSKA